MQQGLSGDYPAPGGVGTTALPPLEGLLGGGAQSSSQPLPSLISQNNFYGGQSPWSSQPGMPAHRISPAPQVGDAAVRNVMSGLGGHGSSGGGGSSGFISSFGADPLQGGNGSLRHNISSASMHPVSSGLSAGNGGGGGGSMSGSLSPASVGPGGVCMDFLAGGCPRGAACSLLHALPSSMPAASAQPQQQYLQQQQQLQLHQQQLHQQQRQLQQQQRQQQHQQQDGLSDGMLLLRGLEMTRTTAELTRQELGAVVMGQARLLQEQAAGIAALEKQVAELQRSFSSALLTFEQRHWAALYGNEQRITGKIEQTIGSVLATIEGKLEALVQHSGAGGDLHRQLSSNASNAHWPATGPPHRAVSASGPPAAAGGNKAPSITLGGGAISSGNLARGDGHGFGRGGENSGGDAAQRERLAAALQRINLGGSDGAVGNVGRSASLPPTTGAFADGRGSSLFRGDGHAAGHQAPSPEQEEVEALLREISEHSGGSAAEHAAADGDGIGHPDGDTPHAHGQVGSWPPPGLGGMLQQQGQDHGGGHAANRLRGGDSSGSGGQFSGLLADGIAGASRQDNDAQSSAGSRTTGGSSNPNVPEKLEQEVKEIQDQETGELLRAFERNQGSGRDSDSQNGHLSGELAAGATAGRTVSGSTSSDVTSSEMPRRVAGLQQAQDKRAAAGDVASSQHSGSLGSWQS